MARTHDGDLDVLLRQLARKFALVNTALFILGWALGLGVGWWLWGRA